MTSGSFVPRINAVESIEQGEGTMNNGRFGKALTIGATVTALWALAAPAQADNIDETLAADVCATALQDELPERELPELLELDIEPDDSASPVILADASVAQSDVSAAQPEEDPRDAELRQLKEQLDKQAEELRQLRQLVDQLMPLATSAKNQEQKEGQPAEAVSDSAQGEGSVTAVGSATVAPDTENNGAAAAKQPAPEDSAHAILADENDEEKEEIDPGPEPPSADEIVSKATPSGTGQQPALNPNISFVLLGGAKFGGEEGNPDNNTFYVREAELSISAPVDPSTNLEAYITLPKDENVELEEAFATYSGLPGGLQLRGGLLKNDFGRLNTVHAHALPQIDVPLPLEQVFGEEGLRSPGVEVSWLTPLPWYSKFVASVGTRYGEAEEDEFALFPAGGSKSPLITARWENMADLNEDTTLMLGLSYAGSKIDNGIAKNGKAYGADLTLKWKPQREEYRELVWSSEYLKAEQDYAMPDTPTKKIDGWYTYLSYRLNKLFRVGVRYDDSRMANDEGRMNRISGIVELIPNEWNSLQLQFNHCNPDFAKSYNEVLLQWNLMIGPHAAHKY